MCQSIHLRLSQLNNSRYRMVWYIQFALTFLSVYTFVSALPPKCANVKCSIPQGCNNPSVPAGSCCPECPPKNQACRYGDRYCCYANGRWYRNGANFKIECNSCFCRDGNVGCTLMACPTSFSKHGNTRKGCFYKMRFYKNGARFMDECNHCFCRKGKVGCNTNACAPKAGNCPKPVLVGGACKKACDSDYDCQGKQKCCENECGRRCADPWYKGCPYKNNYYAHGAQWKDACNTCTCDDGTAHCTEKLCNKGCVYKGRPYAHLATWKDDCNDCSCNNGIVSCTDQSCNERCYYKGKYYQHLATWKDFCNDCGCKNGKVSCSNNWCYKPGDCPNTDPIKPCVKDCSGDQSCPGKQKCCRTWCGNQCRDPQPKGCTYKGKTYAHGDRFRDICNDCWCNDGNVGCTKRGCLPKPGLCPYRPVLSLPCNNQCQSDYDCKGEDKCCKTTCGTECTTPLPDCTLVDCLPLSCNPLYQHTPPGKCCPVCDCSRAVCKTLTCQYQITPRGACCPVCDCSSVVCPHLECGGDNQYTPPGTCCPVCKNGCTYRGKYYEEGESVKTGPPCEKCECRNRRVSCHQKQCKPVYCDEPYTKHGDCCPSCPEYKGGY